MNYEEQLDRALDAVPDLATEEDRLSVPDPSVQGDGAFTRLVNLPAIADALSRDPEHVHRTIQRDLGTNGQWTGSQARYNGQFTVADFDAAIAGYVAEYVTCSECGRPDTRLVTEDRNQMLRCTACGAFRPVKKRSSAPTQRQRPTLEEGTTYELEITGTGRKGDGVAEKGKYTIFVPGAQKGQTVSAAIESISGTLAFARRVS
ncbi:MAG: translation initiation factor IF-2 subunit beta [Halobacteriales archaeon]|nr:translation initiation factor IF-2 subunit beta [Halobacteriales archaeon]